MQATTDLGMFLFGILWGILISAVTVNYAIKMENAAKEDEDGRLQDVDKGRSVSE